LLFSELIGEGNAFAGVARFIQVISFSTKFVKIKCFEVFYRCTDNLYCTTPTNIKLSNITAHSYPYTPCG